MVNRNVSIDTLKGALIFLVVLGHILLGTLDENPLRYLIYSFHMPAFFFISGYLLNIEKLKALSIKDFCAKYWHRMLKMWLLAWCIYTLYVLRNDISFIVILQQIYRPYYHLWFVPALFLSISLVYFVFRIIKSDVIALCMLMLFGLFAFNLSISNFKVSSFISLEISVFLFLGIVFRQLKPITVSHWGGNNIFYFDSHFSRYYD